MCKKIDRNVVEWVDTIELTSEQDGEGGGQNGALSIVHVERRIEHHIQIVHCELEEERHSYV